MSDKTFTNMFKNYKAVLQSGHDLLRQSTGIIIKDVNLALALLHELDMMAQKGVAPAQSDDRVKQLEEVLRVLPNQLKALDLKMVTRNRDQEQIKKEIKKIEQATQSLIGKIPEVLPQTFDDKSAKNRYNLTQNLVSTAIQRIYKSMQFLNRDARTRKIHAQPTNTATEQAPVINPKNTPKLF